MSRTTRGKHCSWSPFSFDSGFHGVSWERSWCFGEGERGVGEERRRLFRGVRDLREGARVRSSCLQTAGVSHDNPRAKMRTFEGPGHLNSTRRKKTRRRPPQREKKRTKMEVGWNEGLEVATSLATLQRASCCLNSCCCRTRHDGDPLSNMNAWMSVKAQNLDLESCFKYMNPTLECKDVKCKIDNTARVWILTNGNTHCVSS